MSFNICCLSGMLAQEPVVSKSGHVFEKRLILKQIEASGRCPISHLVLNIEDLIDVKIDNNQMSIHKPRSINSTSMPGMFTDLQVQWETLLLETFTLKKELDTSRQELAHTLYQNDAAIRVIANLVKERDLAREEFANYKDDLGDVDDDVNVDEFDYMGITKELVNRITELSFKLIADRKARKINNDNVNNNVNDNVNNNANNIATFEEIWKYQCKETLYPFINKEGITSADIKTNINSADSNFIVVGGNAGNVAFLEVNHNLSNNKFSVNENSKSVVSIHTKKVNDIKFYPSSDILGFATCSDDGTAALMIKSELTDEFTERYRIGNPIHTDVISGLSFHPLHEYALVSSFDGYWSFHNLLKGVILHKEYNGHELSTIRFHPDGGIFATGQKNGIIKLWDISSGQEFMKLQETGMQGINSLSFSENGFYLASCGEEDTTVRIWDIRKNKVVKSFDLNKEGNFVNKVEFDYSGNYLTLAGHEIGICDVKTMEVHKVNFENHKNVCTAVKFESSLDSFFISTSLDGDIKIHAN